MLPPCFRPDAKCVMILRIIDTMGEDGYVSLGAARPYMDAGFVELDGLSLVLTDLGREALDRA